MENSVTSGVVLTFFFCIWLIKNIAAISAFKSPDQLMDCDETVK